jgi:LysM repeat protein
MSELCLKRTLHSLVRNVLLTVLVFGCAGSAAYSQGDPGAREDAQIERQKILRAADQIEAINDQHNKMVEEMEKLKAQIKAISEENAGLAKQVAEIKTQALKEREALLDQISKLLAEQEKRLTEKIQQVAKAKTEETPRKPTPAKEPAANVKEEEGYDHVVQSGQTLWSIAQAYRDKGVKVTVEDIRKANNLKEGQGLRSGQKLFIPGK